MIDNGNLVRLPTRCSSGKLRERYGDDIVTGIADVAELFTLSASGRLDETTQLRLTAMAAQSSPSEVIDALIERSLPSGGTFTAPPLAAVVSRLARLDAGVIFDPACGSASLLLTVAPGPNVRVVGQEVNETFARLATARAALANLEFSIVVGDSLQADGWPELRADLVVCDPPVGSTAWGRENLMLDPRWEFGVPTKAEVELAWLQHCYAHLAPGGTAIVAMPPSVAYRRPGRRIRAELVRRGVLTQVTALPPGLATAHSQPVHLWSVVRPGQTSGPVASVRFCDLSDVDPMGSLLPDEHHVAEVPLVDLLDEDVDLTPTRYTKSTQLDWTAQYSAARKAALDQLSQVARELPSLTAGPGSLEGSSLRVSDLSRAGLVVIHDGTVTSNSDQLDTAFLRGFLHSSTNVSRATSGSGSFRADIRGARIPQMSIDEQRRYAVTFQALDRAEERLREITLTSLDMIARAREVWLPARCGRRLDFQ